MKENFDNALAAVLHHDRRHPGATEQRGAGRPRAVRELSVEGATVDDVAANWSKISDPTGETGARWVTPCLIDRIVHVPPAPARIGHPRINQTPMKTKRTVVFALFAAAASSTGRPTTR